ncbi:Zinc metalloproteinase nas-4 [Chionoecetes opilio]|uniref:Metalloendopeptidase n=1 Tax=Chionoecetes opilio TaxID=41210 RepID=A0A8J4Y5B2_CHIOP|nr:Zinc metalloproteinase nas-4 [Chionoecetes opilio]
MKGVVTSVCLCLAALASLVLAAPGPTDPTFPRTGQEWTPEYLMNPDELGDYFEGDIQLPLPPRATNGMLDEKYRWTDGKVYYKFDPTFRLTWHRKKVIAAMDKYEELTNNCITFHERTDEKDYILFILRSEDTCHSAVGRRGGKQNIVYTRECIKSKGSIMHQMYHALGFEHEQSRSDRDEYVTIMWDNIEFEKKKNFEKKDSDTVTPFGEAYDYGSVMHYGRDAFATNNGKDTIVTKDPAYQGVIGQRKGLSDVDIRKLLKMYKC